jgi:redox-sensitive bicupin YhaK (pirin superfamily)
VLIGDFDDLHSPARHDTPLVGVELALSRAATVPLRADWEYGIVVLQGAVGIHGRAVVPGKLACLGLGGDVLTLDVREPTKVILLGGEPFEEPIVMWWNFVGRTRAEIEATYLSWQAQDDRFGKVASVLPRIPATVPFWQRSPGDG